ncbi:ABC transporter permease [Prescottella equi]|uniref:ABC transporter permease n=1 Tax=Rhodococcus hoagii TaxID=43767 RepID=UPI0009BE0BAC|nr:ABC transporter permease [Prescottella equi]MBM4726498.1 ABC transporter permease subunit [Prescottella equi]OQQ21463.1 ABC transporter permease [Prescottella equi]
MGRAHPDRRLLVSAVVLAAIVAYALLVPWLAGVDDRLTNFADARLAPTTDHWFGTDNAGRDLFVRVAAGLRVSLFIAAVCAAASTVLGVGIGVAAATFGGWTDRIVMRAVDGVNALPHLLLGIVIVALRGSLPAIIASIALTHWTQVARIARSEVLGVRGREYIDAAHLAGAGRWHVMRHHLAPAAAGQALIAVVLLLPHAIWHETTLSFLGLGLPPHQPSLGTLLQEARSTLLLGGWWTLLFPSLLLVAATLAVAGIGAALRDRINPPILERTPR